MKRNYGTYQNIILIVLLVVLTVTMASCEVGSSSYENFLNANSIAQEKGSTTPSGTTVQETGPAPQTSQTTSTSATTQDPTPSSTTSQTTTSTSTTTNRPTGTQPSINQETNITQNDIVINGAGSTDVSYAAAKGLRSVVSVYASDGSSSASSGSGVIYRLDEETGSALVITNYHVVSTNSNSICNQIKLCLYGLEYSDYVMTATYVGGSANYDLAVLYVQNSTVLKDAIASGAAAAATVANSDDVAVGQSVIAIGNPNGNGISVTAGVVSVDSEYINMTIGSSNTQFRVIRIDAPVNPGNSGCGLFNAKGELIGIVNAKITSTSVENIGYAIPSNVARAISDNIIDYCFGKDCKVVMRAMLGIEISTLSISTAYDPETGVMSVTQKIAVHSVSAGGLGDGVLQVDDVINSVTVGDKKTVVTRQHQIIDSLLDARVGDTVSFEILRDGEAVTVSTVITEASLTEYQ